MKRNFGLVTIFFVLVLGLWGIRVLPMMTGGGGCNSGISGIMGLVALSLICGSILRK